MKRLLLASAIVGAFSAPPKVIVMIIADDYGWWNIDMNGHNPEAQTPNLRELSDEGIRLGRHYVYKYCSPTRSSLLTGRLPIHVNQNNEGNNLLSASGADIRMTTLAQKLKQADPPFQTHLFGKWHCGARTPANLPTNRGYDHYLGFLKGMEDHFTQMSNFNGYQHNFVDLWQDHGPADNSINGTFSAFRDAKYAIRALDGWDPTTKESLFLDVRFGLTHGPYQVPDQYRDPNITNKCRQTLVGMANIMDEGIGNLTKAIKAKGVWDDTLLIFSADNGGLTHGGGCNNNYPLRGGKTSDFEGGVRVAAFVSGGYLPKSARGKVHAGLMHIADWYATLSTLVGVDPTDNVSEADGEWNLEKKNWNCGDDLVQLRDDSGLDLQHCLAFCSSYPYTGHWTGGATTCRCYSSCHETAEEGGHATSHGITNEVYSHSSSESVPGVDGVDQWAAILSKNSSASARHEIPLAFCTNVGGASDDCVSAAQGVKDTSKYDQAALIADGGRWKVLFGNQFGFGFFTGPEHPNGTANYHDAGCPSGCLFDLDADPTEHVDVKQEHPEVFARLKARLEEVGKTVWQTNHTDAPHPTQCLSDGDAAAKYNGHLGPQCTPDATIRIVV